MKIVLALIALILSSIVATFGQEPKGSDTVWVKDIGSQVNSVIFSSDGKSIYATAKNPIKLSVETGVVLMEYIKPSDSIYNANIAISRDEKLLFTGSNGNTIYIWNAEKGVIIDSLLTNYKEVEQPVCRNIAVSDKYIAALIDFLYISHKGEIKHTNAVYVWDINTHSKLTIIENGSVEKIVFSPDEKYLALIQGGGIFITNTDTWKIEFPSFPSYHYQNRNGSFSPDGSLLASCSYGNEIKIWDLETREIYKEILSFNYYCNHILFINNYNFISAGNYHGIGSIEIWHLNELFSTKKYLINVNDIDCFAEKQLISVATGNNIILLDLSQIVSVPSDIYNNTTISPNPTNSVCQINFTIQKSGITKVSISDMLSNQIVLLCDNFLEKGEHNLQWIADRVPNGTYFCNIIGQDFSKTLKIMVQK